MDNKFKADDRVSALVSHKDDDPSRGKVITIEASGDVLVEWDARYGRPARLVRLAPSALMLESELEAKMSDLEAQFNLLSAQVTGKLQEAAKAINEAQEIATTAGLDLQDMHEVTYVLERAMDNAGWSTSSWHC